MSLIDEAQGLLKRWEREHRTLPLPHNYPNDILRCIADVIDRAREENLKQGLDPYDDFKNVTDNVESDLVKLILDHEFLEILTSTYLTGSRYSNDEEVKVLSARIMSSAMNGIDTNAYFKEIEDDMIELLYRWALTDREPLTTYAVEMLSYGETLCSRFHQYNVEMVNMLLRKLKGIHARAKAEYVEAHASSAQDCIEPWNEETQDGTECKELMLSKETENNPLVREELVGKGPFELIQCQAVLHFLLSLGEYQEFLGLIMKNSILKLLLSYISITDVNSLLIFDIIRYLSALLCHKKFASDFMNYDGLQLLMNLPFNQRASTGVSTCLYALVFHSTVMERLCAYNSDLISPMVTMCLRLLKGKHESGRSHATLFLTFAFQYRVIIEEFDRQNGLKSFIDILRETEAALSDPPTVEVVAFLLRQKMKHTCNAIQHYLACQTILYAEHLRRVKDHQGVGMSPQIYMTNKALELDETIGPACDFIQVNADYDAPWTPMDNTHNLGGFEVAIQGFFLSEGWRSTRYDATPCIISILTFLTVLPRYQHKLTEQYTAPYSEPTDGQTPRRTEETHTAIKLALSAAECYGAIDIQKAALNLIVGVVCGPYRANTNNPNLTPAPVARKSSSDDVMHKMWSAIRTNNGIKVLMSLLLTKTPLFHADELRMAACKALNGLCRSRGVRQIASKLHLMSSGQLLALMREPILPENVETHAKFCTYTSSLLEVLFGVSTDKTTNEPSLLNKMTKVDIVSKTPITYNKDEIYHLLHSTLLEHGLKGTANALADEVKQKLKKDIVCYPKAPGLPTPSGNLHIPPITPCKKLTIRNSRSRDPSQNFSQNCSQDDVPTSNRSTIVPQKSGGVIDHLTALETKNISQAYHPPTLDELVNNFMRDQHMRCEYPMSIVPPFSLFREHRCPDPEPALYEAPVNMAMRLQRKQYGHSYGGRSGRYRDYKYIFSKFKPYYTLRVGSRSEDWDDINFTSCLTFTNYVVAGMNNGQIKVYEMSQYPPYRCLQTTQPTTHNPDCDPITSLALSQSGKMMVSAATSDATDSVPRNNCVLWSVASGKTDCILEQRHEIPDVDHATFSNLHDDYLLCTMDHKCAVVDSYTGRVVNTMNNPHGSNSYYKNHAVFNFTDDLVLNDGVLWDYRTPVAIHKFDKFNNFVSGVFSPSGIEIIINTEIWDLRSFKLLNTINSLDNCLLRYNHSRDVMYGLSHIKQEIHDHEISPTYKHVLGPFESTFKTFDAGNGFSSLGTYDVRKQIVDLSCCRLDRMVVTVESGNEDFTTLWSGGSVIKLYLVGRSKASKGSADDDDEDEDDDEEDDEDSGENSEEFDDEDDDESDSSTDSETLQEPISSPQTSQHHCTPPPLPSTTSYTDYSITPSDTNSEELVGILSDEDMSDEEDDEEDTDEEDRDVLENLRRVTFGLT